MYHRLGQRLPHHYSPSALLTDFQQRLQTLLTNSQQFICQIFYSNCSLLLAKYAKEQQYPVPTVFLPPPNPGILNLILANRLDWTFHSKHSFLRTSHTTVWPAFCIRHVSSHSSGAHNEVLSTGAVLAGDKHISEMPMGKQFGVPGPSFHMEQTTSIIVPGLPNKVPQKKLSSPNSGARCPNSRCHRAVLPPEAPEEGPSCPFPHLVAPASLGLWPLHSSL